MENKEMNFSGKGILTVITGIIIMGSTIATLSFSKRTRGSRRSLSRRPAPRLSATPKGGLNG